MLFTYSYTCFNCTLKFEEKKKTKNKYAVGMATVIHFSIVVNDQAICPQTSKPFHFKILLTNSGVFIIVHCIVSIVINNNTNGCDVIDLCSTWASHPEC